MEYKHSIIDIDTFKYAVFEMEYYYSAHTDLFVVGKYEESKTAKVYILIPSWVEMQDLYQKSAKKNIVTHKYETNEDNMDHCKILFFCNKIIDSSGKVYQITEDFVYDLQLDISFYLLNVINHVINEYYIGSGLSDDKRKDLSKRCFDYYTAIGKSRRGERIEIPPSPGIVMLLNICDIFNCTPDVARKISFSDIEMMCIARRQEQMAKLMLQ